MKENKYTFDNLKIDVKNIDLKAIGSSTSSFFSAFLVIPLSSFLIMFIIVALFEIWELGKVSSYILAPIFILINFFALSQYFIVEEKYSKTKARIVVGMAFLMIAFLFLLAFLPHFVR